jgi:hypothetical protein
VVALLARELARHLVEPVLRALDRQPEALALLDLELLQLGLDRLDRHRVEIGPAVVLRRAHSDSLLPGIG